MVAEPQRALCLVPSLYPAGSSWQQLVPSGISWYHLGTSWYQLVPPGYQLVPAGTPLRQLLVTSWYPAGNQLTLGNSLEPLDRHNCFRGAFSQRTM